MDQTRVIMLLEARIAPRSSRGQALEAGANGGGPPKTSRNSHQPPSRVEKASGGTVGKKSKKARPSQPGVARALTAAPDVTRQEKARSCGHCGADVGSQRQACRHTHDHIEIPPLVPQVTRIELHGGRCACCGRRFRATPPPGMPPGTPFGPNVQGTALLPPSQPSCELRAAGADDAGAVRAHGLGRGAIMRGRGVPAAPLGGNAFARMAEPLETLRQRVKARLATAELVTSDETTMRVGGATHWLPETVAMGVYLTEDAILHEMVPRRSKPMALEVLRAHRPAVCVSDRYAGQQDLARAHQICLAHLLRDVQ